MMGAAVAIDYITKASNNTSYVGNGAVKVSVPVASSVASAASTVSSSSGITAGSVVNVGGKILSRANIWLTGAQILFGLGSEVVKYFTEDEKAKMTPEELQVVKQYETMQKVAGTQQSKTKEKKQEAQTIAETVNYQQGQALPAVLSQNAKALTLSVNSLNATLSEQFGLLNNYMMANLIYQQQFLDLKSEVANLKVESMEYNKTSQTIKDLDGKEVTKLSPREAELSKNATLAKDTTDKINYDIDDLIDASVDIDISDIVGYELGTDIMSEYISRLGGSVNG